MSVVCPHSPHEAAISGTDAPCRRASALGIPYRRLAERLAAGHDDDAARILREKTPFAGLASVFGDPPAEKVCPLHGENSSFTVSDMLRYLYAVHPDILLLPLDSHYRSGRKAAVLGSGPAGLQAAWTLCEHGHYVTVFEAAAEIGITLLHPPVQESPAADDTPLPAVSSDIVRQTVHMLSQSGICFYPSSPKGQADINALCLTYDAVICACGRGSVLPADTGGHVRDNLFAAGSCVKNKKSLGALQAMADAGKAALTACGMLDELPRSRQPEYCDGTESPGWTPPHAAIVEADRVANIRRMAALCLLCDCAGRV